jgi:hypothetical protein
MIIENENWNENQINTYRERKGTLLIILKGLILK